MTELIETAEDTFDQVDHLWKSVDQIAIDVDELQLYTIRIETQPANLNACRIIYMDQVPHTQSEDVFCFYF